MLLIPIFLKVFKFFSSLHLLLQNHFNNLFKINLRISCVCKHHHGDVVHESLCGNFLTEPIIESLPPRPDRDRGLERKNKI